MSTERLEGHYWVKWCIATPWEVGFWTQHPEDYIGWHWQLCGNDSRVRKLYQINETMIPPPTE